MAAWMTARMTGRARPQRLGLAPQRGFTLFETIFVIALFTAASLVIGRMQPRLFEAQTNGRDQYVGVEVLRSCAERLLSLKRGSGIGAVTNTVCNGLGGVGGFAANPTVVLKDAAGSTVSTCPSGAGSSCTATVTAAKTSGPAATLAALTVQFTN